MITFEFTRETRLMTRNNIYFKVLAYKMPNAVQKMRYPPEPQSDPKKKTPTKKQTERNARQKHTTHINITHNT